MSEEVGEKAGENSGNAVEVKIEDLVLVVGNMNRFLALLASSKAFSTAEVSLADWLILSTVSGRNTATPNQLIKLLGVAPQRVSQIVERLKDKQLLAKGGATPHSLSLTERGSGLIGRLNADILDILSVGLNGRERSLVAVERHLRSLIQVFTPAKSKAN